jgi:hypothetical protein
MINLKPRIERLERRAQIQRRWEALHKQIAEREQDARNRLADWRRTQEKEGEPDA